MKGKKR